MAVRPSVVLGLVLGLASTHLGAAAPVCRAMAAARATSTALRVLHEPKRLPGPCETMLLQDALHGRLATGGAFDQGMEKVLKSLNDETGFGFTVIFRPSMPEDDGMLLETNPHLRKDVQVCGTHNVVLYVGRAPFVCMPKVVDERVDQAREMLHGLASTAVCAHANVLAPGSAKVMYQSPAPDEPLWTGVPLYRMTVPAQRPLLVADCAPSIPPPPESPITLLPVILSTPVFVPMFEKEVIRDKVIVDRPVQGRRDIEWVLGGAVGLGGAAGALAWSRALGRDQPQNPSRPASPGTAGPALPVTRVRHG